MLGKIGKFYKTVLLIEIGMACTIYLWSPYVIGQTIYIFMLWFVLLLSSSFFPRLISAAADWMSAILPHMVWP